MQNEPYQRLQQAREAAGFVTAKEAALRYGWNEHTYKSHENGTRGIRPDAARRYARAFKVSPGWLLTGESGLSDPGGGYRQKGEMPTLERADSALIPVVGAVQAGVWTEEEAIPVSEQESILIVPDARYEPLSQWAVKVRGDSVNEVIEDGGYAHCVDLEAAGYPKNNDLVVVERIRHQGGLIETTIKRVRVVNDRLELWPASRNKKHNGPIRMGAGEQDIEVRIKGLVIGRYDRF